MAELQIGDRHYTRSQLQHCGRLFPVVQYLCLVYYLELNYDLIRVSILDIASHHRFQLSTLSLLLPPLEHLLRPTSLQFIWQRIPVGVIHLMTHYAPRNIEPWLQDRVCHIVSYSTDKVGHILVRRGLSDDVLKVVDGGLSGGCVENIEAGNYPLDLLDTENCTP